MAVVLTGKDIRNRDSFFWSARLGSGFIAPWLGAAVIALAGLLAYSGSFRGPFIYDDVEAIAENPTIRGLGSAWVPAADTTVSGRPLLNESLAISHALSGNAVWGYHAVNVAIHILAGLVLY